MSIFVRKVGIVGVGHVGSHCAFNLAIQGIADELVLCDTNEVLLAAQSKDLFDASVYFPHRVAISTGPIEALADCDIVVICIAAEIPKIALRDVELEGSVREVKNLVPRLMRCGFDGIVIDITNPCDAITQVVWQESGLDSSKVFGTGTGLDSSRFRSILGRAVGMNPKAINGYMLGEHGNSMFPAWSHVTIGTKPFAELEKTSARFRNINKEEIEAEVRGSGYKVWFAKHGIDFSVASVLAEVVRCIFTDEKIAMPLSVLLNGQYGESGVYASTPVVIGRKGIEEIFELDLTEEELGHFHASCASVRNNVNKAMDIKAVE